MNTIKIDKLIRSRRKTIGLQITNEAQLIVRAPLLASEDYIQKLIQRKESWIKSKQEYFKKRQNKAVIRNFVPGEEFLFLGRNYTLVAIDDLPKALDLGNDILMISPLVLANARDHIENWYKKQALEYLTHKTSLYAQMADLKFQSIKINNATTRWGSCGYKNTLNFTWRLIMAEVIDYVIIHELMHLKQKNHSRKFWDEVRRLMPDYKQQEHWLKHNGYLLSC